MAKDSSSTINTWRRRKVLQTSIAGLVSGTTISAVSGSALAQENESTTDDETGGENETNDEQTDEVDNNTEESTSCDGSPGMSRTSVTTPNSRITTDQPAVIEANFRPDPMIPDECTIMVDLEFSFADSGFQWGGGSDWDQSTSDLLVGQFEVQPGEIRDIRGELHTQGAESGDSVTVIADYEIWFEGNPEESVQQSGIRHTIDVEDPNPPSDDEGEDSISESVPGFGISSAAAGVGGAAYLLKSKLTGDNQ